MMAILKSVGKGILYIIGLPFFLIVLAGASILGVFLLIFMFFKSIILFFTGRSLNDDLPEDIEVKRIKKGASGNSMSTTGVVEETNEEPIVQPYTSTSTGSTPIENAVFGHPLYETPTVETTEEPVIEEETPAIPEEPVQPVEEEPVSSIEIENTSAPKKPKDSIGKYVPRGGSRFIDEEEEEDDSGVTISFGDDDD